jgi:peptidyl-prolyl cis-trans isomerase B (cyclophilin B)
MSLSRTGSIFAYAVAAFAFAAAVAAAPAAKSPRCATVRKPPAKPNGGQKPPRAKLDPKRLYDVTLRTSCGRFTIRLDTRHSPNLAASFVSLVRKGFFNRTVFHRIIPGFVIQGGDPTGTGTGGPGYSTVDKPPRGARYTKYTVAMAKTQAEPPGTAGSQFFVVTAPDAQLAPDYALLGTVTRGRRVVDLIGRYGRRTQEGTPTRVIELEGATIRVSG